MKPIRVEVRVLPDRPVLPLPARATAHAAGLDLPSAEARTLAPGERHAFRTGLVLGLPEGYEGQVRPRSGLAAKHGVTVLNAPGTIDADYRGEVKVLLVNLGAEPFEVTIGTRIAQLIVAPVAPVEIDVVTELVPTERGAGGFGSTGH